MMSSSGPASLPELVERASCLESAITEEKLVLTIASGQHHGFIEVRLSTFENTGVRAVHARYSLHAVFDCWPVMPHQTTGTRPHCVPYGCPCVLALIVYLMVALV